MYEVLYVELQCDGASTIVLACRRTCAGARGHAGKSSLYVDAVRKRLVSWFMASGGFPGQFFA